MGMEELCTEFVQFLPAPLQLIGSVKIPCVSVHVHVLQDEHLFEDWIFSGNALERSVPESVSGTECSKGTWTMFSLSITLMKWGWQLQ